MQIISAYYGSYNIKAIDVTARVIEIVEKTVGSKASILVSHQTFGIADPAPGVKKSLTINYQNDEHSEPCFKSGVEGTTIDFCLKKSHLEVLQAVYSSDKVFEEITGKVQTYLEKALTGYRLPVVGSADFLNQFLEGRDPDKLANKTLTLSFCVNQELITICANDGQTVDLLNKY